MLRNGAVRSHPGDPRATHQSSGVRALGQGQDLVQLAA